MRSRFNLAPWASAIVGNIDWTSLGDDPMGDMQIFAGATSQAALRQRLRGEVETEVAAMLDAIKAPVLRYRSVL